MSDIRIDEGLWASSMDPEGILERWFVRDGEAVAAGDRVAEVRLEGARHEIMSPVSGRLSIVARPNALIEPGAVLATVTQPVHAAARRLRRGP